MSKIFTLLILMTISIHADDILALLKGVENNSALHMNYGQQPFICRPYGVETVDELAERIDVNSSCRQYLNDFRKAHPKERYYAASLLHAQQQYSVRSIEGRCLLNLSSGHSYSEALLEEGYARVLPLLVFKDNLLDYRFKQALRRAKIRKLGIWSDLNVRNCFLLAKE
jgi:hypothetical protein